MRVMVLMKATKSSESGQMPSEKVFTGMMKFNEALVNAGVMLAGEGLHPSTKAKRVVMRNGAKPTVIDGPFSETKELVAGFWIWKVASLDEAEQWVRKMAEYVDDPMGSQEEATIEIRQVFEAEDFGEALPAEVRAKEEELRARTAKS